MIVVAKSGKFTAGEMGKGQFLGRTVVYRPCKCSFMVSKLLPVFAKLEGGKVVFCMNACCHILQYG